MTDKDKIKELEEIAEDILEYKTTMSLRRPLFIEFCGTPKSGKTSCINALNIFLKRNNFKTLVLAERASICPINDKLHPFFNIWTACSAIAEIVKNLLDENNKVDIIIADRAIFDALCWFNWQNTHPSSENKHLDDNSYRTLSNFLKMNLFSKNVDLIYVFKARPEICLNREYANLLTNKEGTIMNNKMLLSFNDAIDNTIPQYEKSFRRIEVIDTSEKPQQNVNYEVTQSILRILAEMLVEKIGYIENIPENQLMDGVNQLEIISNLTLAYAPRHNVEYENYIQPIPIAIFTNFQRDKILLFKKVSSKLDIISPEKGKILIYAGGHIRREDEINDNILETMQNALSREIQEELNKSITTKLNPDFLIYTPKYSIKSQRHLAVCYVVEVDFESTKLIPYGEEFVKKRDTSISGQVVDIHEINTWDEEKFDSWSLVILQTVFRITPIKQPNLF